MLGLARVLSVKRKVLAGSSLQQVLPSFACAVSSVRFEPGKGKKADGAWRFCKTDDTVYDAVKSHQHKLLSSGVWTPPSHPQHEVFWTQALKLSSVASPVSEKDGNSDSSVEETSVSSDEKVEPVLEGNDEPVPEVDKEQAAKAEQENKEALLNSIAQLEALLSEKNSQLVELKERAVTTKAELENVRIRAQREADNTKKYAIQEFAKSLLDVADNLGRALMTIPANVRKELLTDQSEIGKLIKSLVEGLIMTERELTKVFKKFGVEKFEPVGQQFDPNSHLALFEVPDPSKEPGTVALVAKGGYMLHDRVLRPAEVGVVKSLE